MKIIKKETVKTVLYLISFTTNSGFKSWVNDNHLTIGNRFNGLTIFSDNCLNYFK